MEDFDDNGEITEETKALYRQEQDRLIRIIEAFEGLEKTEEWKTLKELVFSKSLDAIQRQILNESLSRVIDTEKLYKLQGEYAWATQYVQTGRFVETCRKQLAEIKRKLK